MSSSSSSTSSSAGLDRALFKQTMSRFASGVTVVTMQVDGVAHGMTASAFCSLSLEPPLVLVCVGKNQKSHKLLAAARRYVVNILDASQERISTYFAASRPGGKDEMASIPTRPGPAGVPYIEGCLAYVDCRVTSVLPGGDHDIFVGEVERLEIDPAREDPLLYYRGEYGRLRSPQ
jgi:flavin reductase (DIM6/NTAB) family NADH-FMN oxidoreductase RutF